jgi:YHS domain-containing protein
MTGVSAEQQEELEQSSWSSKVRSPAAWSDAASYAVADVTMLRRELVIGYTIAGFLAVLVPTHVWNVLFIHGHGFWTSLENALVGPLIAVMSWVCSIGNVPLAAALWSGGISFGGVISFIFADLIAMPLILIYRKFYGTKLTLRIVGLFYMLMATAGLATEGIFRLFHAVPTTRTLQVTSAHFEWNYTTFLNILFLVLAVGVWWLARNKKRFGGGTGYAIDPSCGMQVRMADAPATAVVNGDTLYFCSDRCHSRYTSGQKTATQDGYPMTVLPLTATSSQAASATTAVDPVCGMTVDTTHAAAHRDYADVTYSFCSLGCAQTFDGGPDHYIIHEVNT